MAVAQRPPKHGHVYTRHHLHLTGSHKSSKLQSHIAWRRAKDVCKDQCIWAAHPLKQPEPERFSLLDGHIGLNIKSRQPDAAVWEGVPGHREQRSRKRRVSNDK